MFSYNSKHGWCGTCVGTGLRIDARTAQGAYDDSIRDDDDKGREQSFPSEEAEVEGIGRRALPGVPRRSRLNKALGARRDL